jgi:hypothetical protein
MIDLRYCFCYKNFIENFEAERFERRWLRGAEFRYPERPKNLPSLEPLENSPKFNPRNVRYRRSPMS